MFKRSCLSEGAKAKGMLKHTRGLLVRGPYCLSFSTVKVNSSVLNVVSLCFVQYTYGHNFYNAHNKNVYWQCTGHSECAIQIWGFQSLSRTGLLLKNQSVRSVGSLRRMGRRKSWNIMEQQILGKKLKLVKWRKQVFPPKKWCIAKPSICAFPGLKFRRTASMDDSCGCFGNGLCLVCSRASFSAIASGTHGGSDSNSTCDNCVYWTPINCVCPEIAHTPIHCNYWWMGYLRYTLQFWTPNYIKLLSAQDWNILASQELGATKFRPWDIAFFSLRLEVLGTCWLWICFKSSWIIIIHDSHSLSLTFEKQTASHSRLVMEMRWTSTIAVDASNI